MIPLTPRLRCSNRLATVAVKILTELQAGVDNY